MQSLLKAEHNNIALGGKTLKFHYTAVIVMYHVALDCYEDVRLVKITLY